MTSRLRQVRSPELDGAVSALAQSTPLLLTLPLDQQRLAYDALSSVYPPPEGTEVDDVDAGGVPAELVRAPGARRDAVVLHLHGGGYGIGSAVGYRGFAGRLSAAVGASVLVPDYRLAPEAPFPAAVVDARRAYCWLLSHVGDPARVAVSGDSAGGGLAVALLTGEGNLNDGTEASSPGAARVPRPAGLVLWSPWADLSVGEGRASSVEDPVLTVGWLQERATAYLNGEDPAHPAASPVRADLAGLPPTLVLVGSEEILLLDARRVAERAEAAGVDAVLWEVKGAVHLWPHFVPQAPESQAAVHRAGRFLADRLAPMTEA